MSNNDNFSSLLARGKVTEALIANFLTFKNYEIEDVSDIKKYQDIDTDFLFSDRLGNQHFLEVKSDSRISSTGNIFIEKCIHRVTGTTQGYYGKCQAKILCYYSEGDKIAYMLNWAEIKAIAHTFKHIDFYNKVDEVWAEAYLIPLKYILSHSGLCYTQFDLSEYIKNKENMKEVA